jgi:hypothetical protein
MPIYPEHDKLSKVKDQTQVIGKFIDWCGIRGIQLCELDSDDEFWPLHDFMGLLAAWAGIDRGKIEAEKQQMLAELRRMNGIEE